MKALKRKDIRTTGEKKKKKLNLERHYMLYVLICKQTTHYRKKPLARILNSKVTPLRNYY